MYLINLYPDNFTFRDNWIDKLWVSDRLKKQVIAKVLPENILSNYMKELNEFKEIRKNFLLY